MFKKIVFLSILALLLSKGYKYFENKLINDKNYLSSILNKRKNDEAEKMINMVLNEAKSLAEKEDLELAMSHYLYAFKELGCGWDHMMTYVENETLRAIMESQKSVFT